MPSQAHLANAVVITAAVLFYATLTDLKRVQVRNEGTAVLGTLFVLHAFRGVGNQQQTALAACWSRSVQSVFDDTDGKQA